MSTTVSARLPDDLLAWMKQQPEKTNNELILNALYALKDHRSGGKGPDVTGPDQGGPEWAERLIEAINGLTAVIIPVIQDGSKVTASVRVYKNEQLPEPEYKAKRPPKNHHEPITAPTESNNDDALEKATANFVGMFG